MKVLSAVYHPVIVVVLLSCLSSIWVHTNAQTISNYGKIEDLDYKLVPASNGTLMGYVDRNNKVIIPPKYNAVSFFNKMGYAQIKQDGLFGVIDKTGRIIVPPVSTHSVSNQTAVIASDEGHNTTAIEGIYFINNLTTNQWLLFSPKGTNKVSQIYTSSKSKFDDRLHPIFKSAIDHKTFKFGYKKVEKADGKVNYIDTSFAEVLPVDIINGMPLSRDLFVYLNDDGLAGMFKKDGSKITGFMYYRIDNSGLKDHFIVTMPGASSYQQRRGLINQLGKTILDTIYSEIRYLQGDQFMITQNSGKGIVTAAGKSILPSVHQEITVFNDHLYYVKNKNENFLVNLNGEIISGPYPNISRKYGVDVLTSLRNDSTLFIGGDGKLLFIKKGNYIVNSADKKVIAVMSDQKYGLLDLKGKTLLDPVYGSIMITAIDDVVIVRTGPVAGIYSISKGWLYPDNIEGSKIGYYPSTTTIPDNVLFIFTDSEKISYTNSLQNKSIESLLTTSSGDHRIEKKDGINTIYLANGQKYTYPDDKSLRPVTNGSIIYFEKKETGQTKILDTKFNSLIPDDFSYHQTHAYKGSYAFELYSKTKGRGLYHVDGRWLFGPIENGRISKLTDEIWLFSKADQNQLYNNDLKLINPRLYKGANRFDRTFLEATYSDGKQIDIYTLGGTLLNEGGYSEMIARVGNSLSLKQAQNNDLRSCVTDSLIREIQCFNYADVFPLEGNSEYLIARDLHDFGVINNNGDVFIPFKYKKITYYPQIDLFQIDKGKGVYDLLSINKEINIPNIKSRLNKQNLSEDYLMLQGEEDTYVFNLKTKKHFVISTDLGGLKADKDMVKADILILARDKQTTYVDATRGLLYKIE